MRASNRHGFTLIELSIVLVIIGLIVGGILVGRDLIAAATIRAQISQIEKYKAAVNAFRLKYGYLPGDLPSSRAGQFGFFAETVMSGNPGHQDGNGWIESGSGVGSFAATGEIIGFWRHLSDAQLIDGDFGTLSSGSPIDPATGEISVALTGNELNRVFPQAKIGRAAYVLIIPPENMSYFPMLKNLFLTIGPASMSTDGNWAFAGTRGAESPIEAEQIDAKMDDGIPNTGLVVDGSMFYFAGPPCIVAGHYDVGSANANAPTCALLFAF